MSRPNRSRSVGDEENLARRIAHERTTAGLSYEGLAKLMTDAGCGIHGSAIYKIENAKPPRRITVNELVALAEVFGTTTSDLLTPMELIEQARAAELLERLDQADRGLLGYIGEVVGSYSELLHLAASNSELHEYVMGHYSPNRAGETAREVGPAGAGWYAVEGVPDYDTRPFVEKTKAFFLAILEEAQRLTLAILDAQSDGRLVARVPISGVEEATRDQHPETS